MDHQYSPTVDDSKIHFMATTFVLVQHRNTGSGLNIHPAFGDHKPSGEDHIIRIPVPVYHQQVIARYQEPGILIGD